MKDLDYIVREYLVHSGYQESFNAIELERISVDSGKYDRMIVEGDNNLNKIDDNFENEMKR